MQIKRMMLMVSGLGLCLGLAISPLLAAPAAAADDAWRGEYYNNPTLSGDPAWVRSDREIRFEWSTGAPAPGLPTDNFSVRWTRIVNLEWSGNYRFYVNSDDGIRVWVDDLMVMDKWSDQQEAWNMADVYLSSGEHRLKVEYYEHEGGATAKLVYQPETATLWKAEYFTNIELEGNPGRIDYLEVLDADWGGGGPCNIFHPDWFSARYTRDVFLSSGAYRFVLLVEGGVRLWVDGGLVIDEWHETDKTTYAAVASVAAGNHAIKVEYYDSYKRASVRFNWQPAQPPPPTISGWRGEYYAQPDLTGGSVLVRDDGSSSGLDLNWKDGAPATGLPSDFFSARWTRDVSFSPAGYYRFSITADDGVKLWIDDKLMLDEWHRSDSQRYYVDTYLAAGAHSLKVEYYEHTGLASFRLTWQRANTTDSQSIVDDKDAGFERGGDAAGWTLVRSGYSGQSWRASNRAGWWARWTPPLPRVGRYEVFVYIPSVPKASEKALYYVKHEGDVTTFTINQRTQAGKWVSLGTYHFNANNTEFVHLDGVTEEEAGSRNIGFDAVKWVWRGE